jgi:prepilin signal peptidase PulO-like enzyme (type II secretory pathway)
MSLWVALVLLTLIISIYDLKYQRIPNWATFPLIIAGLLAHFPGTWITWLASVLLITVGFARQSDVYSFLSQLLQAVHFPRPGGHVMGMGDVKLWLALLWVVPTALATEAIIAMLVGWIGVSLGGLVWRAINKEALFGGQTPMAPASVAFVIILFIFGQIGFRI